MVLWGNCDDNDPFFIDRRGADVKTQLLQGPADYLVVYDERVENYQRIRWTIAHETGHIVLGHLISFEAIELCLGSLTESEKSTGMGDGYICRKSPGLNDHDKQTSLYPDKG